VRHAAVKMPSEEEVRAIVDVRKMAPIVAHIAKRNMWRRPPACYAPIRRGIFAFWGG
jgi:hypothetical protein